MDLGAFLLGAEKFLLERTRKINFVHLQKIEIKFEILFRICIPKKIEVIEKMLSNRLLKTINKFNIVAAKQFGFRRNCLCIHAIITATEIMRSCKDSKNIEMACFIDLQKAFDTIDHSIPMIKI